MPRRVETTELIDLFPFLSVMLCVVGVLAFLQILLSIGISGSKRLSGQVRAGNRFGYQVLCKPDGVVLLPPIVDESVRALRVIGRTENNSLLLDLSKERCRKLAEVRKQGQKPSVLGDEERARTLREIQLVNHAARRHSLQHQEFLLFVIYPGGGAQYHAFRTLLNRAEFTDIQSGLLPVAPDAQVDVSSCPEEGI